MMVGRSGRMKNAKMNRKVGNHQKDDKEEEEVAEVKEWSSTLVVDRASIINFPFSIYEFCERGTWSWSWQATIMSSTDIIMRECLFLTAGIEHNDDLQLEVNIRM